MDEMYLRYRIRNQVSAGTTRARHRSLPATLTVMQWRARLLQDGGMCALCRQPVSPERLQLDHIIPIAQNGGHTLDNVQPLCLSCNSRKRVRPFSMMLREYWPDESIDNALSADEKEWVLAHGGTELIRRLIEIERARQAGPPAEGT